LDDPRTYYWNLLLVHPLERGLQFLATDLGLGAGFAIIIFTILIRIVLLPLTLQQVRSQKALQRLQPELKALQKKYGGDREKLSIETMALYKQHGVNPAASCLPLLLQMPVLFALYAALMNLGAHDEAFQRPWGWLTSLHQPDVITIPGLNFPLPGILPVLAAATQWVQQKMMTPPTDDPQQRMQNQMMQFFPLMMLWFGLSFSSGLALYWVTQNVFGIVQQYFITGWGSLLPSRVPPDGGAPGGGGGGSPAGGAAAELARNGSARASRETARSGPRAAGGRSGQRGPREGRRASGKR
jgi:YidC/Oxa1 family membrane protein insertase